VRVGFYSYVGVTSRRPFGMVMDAIAIAVNAVQVFVLNRLSLVDYVGGCRKRERIITDPC
jgi:hypothetical protein